MFKKWVDYNYGYADAELGVGGYRLVRKDTTKDYTPDNCELVSSSEMSTRIAAKHKGEPNKRSYKHGMSHTKLHKMWSGIKTRCYNPKSDLYYEYGKRGITMDSEWRNSFESFYEWFKTQGVSEDDLGVNGLSIDRIDSNGNYEPSNCRFVNASVQSSNRRLIFKNNISSYHGIRIDSKSEKYRAILSYEKKDYNFPNRATKYEAMLDYDKYVKEHKLPHPTNNLTLVKFITATPFTGVNIKYSFKDDYYLSGIYSKIANNDTIPDILLEWIKENDINLGNLTQHIQTFMSREKLTGKHVVFETAISSITAYVFD